MKITIAAGWSGLFHMAFWVGYRIVLVLVIYWLLVLVILVLGQINNEYFYVLLCVNLKGLVVIDEELRRRSGCSAM